jgi:hypothetical protein
MQDMERNYKKYNNRILIAVTVMAGMFACQKTGDQEGSELSGATITQIESRYGGSVKPKYELLTSQPEMKFALFFTYEDERYESSDPAVVEMKRVRSWLLTGGGVNDKPFLPDGKETEIDSSSQTRHYRIEGTGPGFLGKSDEVRYVFTLVSGTPEGLAREFGKAMATHNVTMINGHFYPRDLKAAESGSSGLYKTGRFSQIYGPAMDAFKQNAAELPLYRIVVFNGCQSEKIEDLMLDTAKEIGQGETIEIIGQRGRSNYYDFGEQSTALVLNLMKMQPWTEVLRGFKVANVRGERMKPVLRNTTIGGR